MGDLPDVRRINGDTRAPNRDDDWLHFPIAWAETGQFGRLMVRPESWRGFAYRYQAAGAPAGEPSAYRWWYEWDGRCFQPYARIEPPTPPKGHRPTIWGSLAWSAWWSWFPSIFVGWGLTALFVGPDGANAGDTPVPGILLTMVGFWALVHWARCLRRTPK